MALDDTLLWSCYFISVLTSVKTFCVDLLLLRFHLQEMTNGQLKNKLINQHCYACQGHGIFSPLYTTELLLSPLQTGSSMECLPW